MFYPEIGGVEVVAKQIAEIGLISFDKSIVLTFNKENKIIEENLNGLEIIRLNALIKRDPIRLSTNFSRYLRKFSDQNNVFVFHFPSIQSELFFRLRDIKGYKICFYHADIASHGTIGNIYNKFIVDKFLSKMDKIIASSPNIVETSPLLSKYKSKVEVIPSSVDVKHFHYFESNKRKDLFDMLKCNMNSDPKIILYIGRFGRYKGLDYFVKAFEFLPKNYFGILIGDGPTKMDVKFIVDSKKLNNRILFLDHVSYDELPKYYSSSDVFILPSTDRGEAFGLVAVEAMACGVPVVTTELGTGTSYHNVDKVTGRVVEPRNSQQIANAILEITKTGNYDRKLIRKRAKEFSLEKFESKWRKLFKTIQSGL